MIRDRIGAIARYIVTVLLLAVLFLATGSGWVLGLTALLLLTGVTSLAANLYVRKYIRGEITIPTTVAKETECEGILRLENRSRLPAPKLCCKLGLVNDLTREEAELDLFAGMGAKRETTCPFRLESRFCGRIYVYLKSTSILDYFGLFGLSVPVTASARITVLPELFSCDAEVSPAAAVSDDSTAARKGDDRTETFQLREYRSGDDIRQIHWKLSSKLGNLILREPSQSISRSILVFWDKRKETAPENMDAMAEVTASVCQALCDRGISFDLGWTEKEEWELQSIRDEDALLQTIPALVTQAGSVDCPEPDTSGYGQVIRITGEIPEGEIPGNTVLLLCTREPYGNGKIISFGWENYREKLERLEL